MLRICDRAPDNYNGQKTFVICQCKCGNYTVIDLRNFRTGHTKSCGCYSKEKHKEFCREIGKLPKKGRDYSKIENPYYIFLERTGQKDKNNSFYWYIKCKKCGQIYVDIPASIISDTRRKGNNPCDCWKRKSKGVLKLKSILQESHINFIEEYTFDTCLSPKGNLLKFDFFLPEYNILIEYDGEQHFSPQSFGDTKTTGEEKFILIQQYDKIKDNWCKEHGIKLIRISYKQYNTLQLQDLIS